MLPTCPRQPPDGVETPSDAVEKALESTAPSRLPPRLPVRWPTSRTRLSYTSRSQDARSEASVKDKIAMFSTEQSSSTEILDKCGTLPARNTPCTTKHTSYNYSDISSLDRRLTKSQDNLDEVPRSYKRPEVLGALESTNVTVNKTPVKANRSLQTENKPLFYGSATTLPSLAESSFTQPVFHARSSSDDNGSNIHKSNLEYLIEQRKKSMSKLRGLVIPETNQGPIIDLPAIKVQDSLYKPFEFNFNQNNNEKRPPKQNQSKTLNLNDKKWKVELLSNNIPKYSPAFKRKSLQVYTPTSLSKESTPERKLNGLTNALNKNNSRLTPSKPPRTSLDIKAMTELSSSTLPSRYTLLNPSKMTDLRNYNNVEIKICTATDVVDSDNDSAMSSTQSSYRSSASSPLHNLDSIESDSSRLSPRICHLASYSLTKTEIPTKSSTIEKSCEEYVKRNVCRSVSSDTNVSLSSSAGSAAASSGSQASCSSLESSVADSDKKKVAKTYNIDTINRRNILASAKCRSGRDANLNSPVIETKFAHESSDKSPSPPNPLHKASDRLSTLTPVVSAITNKGESRRRNKVIAETDSDSDEEVSVRQRKTDFKNPRLKRNLSSSNKHKQNEISPENTKVEEAPKAISERIIQEIKKAGLDSYNTLKSKTIIENNHSELSRVENYTIIKKDEKVIKTETILKPKPEEIKSVPAVVMTNEKQKQAVEGNKAVVTNGKIKHAVVAQAEGPSKIINLKRNAGSGVGLILAGGIDCEAKEVTVSVLKINSSVMNT